MTDTTELVIAYVGRGKIDRSAGVLLCHILASCVVILDPSDEPVCMTRSVSEPGPTYIRSAHQDSCTNIPLAADWGSRRRYHSHKAAF